MAACIHPPPSIQPLTQDSGHAGSSSPSRCKLVVAKKRSHNSIVITILSEIVFCQSFSTKSVDMMMWRGRIINFWDPSQLWKSHQSFRLLLCECFWPVEKKQHSCSPRFWFIRCILPIYRARPYLCLCCIISATKCILTDHQWTQCTGGSSSWMYHQLTTDPCLNRGQQNFLSRNWSKNTWTRKNNGVKKKAVFYD